MASFDDVGTTINLKELIGDIAVNTFDNLVRGVLFELMSTHVNNFNLMNYDFMNIHMIRNTYEKQITLSTIGENAYPDGNGDVTATPAFYPTYTKGNNYMEFVSNTREAEKKGILTTRVQKAGEENRNLYWDADPKEITNKVEYTGRMIDRNSILYKTKKLMRQKKLKTIISEFHTKPGVEYNGQIGTKNYGESHGRNLLTKNAALGDTSYDGYKVNGYDNPYCRVWTHHYKYDQLKKTMRANSDSLDNWKGFEWNESDKGHKQDTTTYGDGENYDYAWRGKHNQDRIAAHSVLDRKTGLVKVTPQYGDTEETNRHTKDCMFSIENLAWKDYDPYSFEQALSWEQRGPFGGRIMWFPPYGIEVTETATAKWQPNDFIGRGEPVYTYVNSERSGNLSFIMVTDHPSSVDYASWWDDNNETENTTDSSGNCENDYLRYFAGCANGDNGLIDKTKDDPNDSKTGGLIVKPTPLTDEYLQDKGAPLIKKEKLSTPPPQSPSPQEIPSDDKNPPIIEFYMFFPNNYSGRWDAPYVPGAKVNAIAYLLGGRDAQKHFLKEKPKDYGQDDYPLDVNSKFDYGAEPGHGQDCYIGYEMNKGGITTSDCINPKYGFYIQGGSSESSVFEAENAKKWQYRIDHIIPYTGGNSDNENTINQNNYGSTTENLQDLKTNRLNLKVSSDFEQFQDRRANAKLYSFAEVAAAMYSERMLNYPSIYQYLLKCGVNEERVNELINVFDSDWELEKLECWGAASSQDGGSSLGASRNKTLADNRAKTITAWIHTYERWANIENTYEGENTIITTNASAGQRINDKSAKIGRCAHCVMTFSSGVTVSKSIELKPVVVNAQRTEETRDIVGFKYLYPEPQADGSVWHYYKKDGSITYYDQKGGGNDNYEDVETNDIVVYEQDIIDIFNNVKPEQVKRIKADPHYRGLYNERGFYIDGFDYHEKDDPGIVDFDYEHNKNYDKGVYVFDNGNLYITLDPFACVVQGKTKKQIWDEYGIYFNRINNVMTEYDCGSDDCEDSTEGDIVLIMENDNETFYRCKSHYHSACYFYEFDEDDWDLITPDNIEANIIDDIYTFIDEYDGFAEPNDIIFDGVFKVCVKNNYSLPLPGENDSFWSRIQDFDSSKSYYDQTYVVYNDNVYYNIEDVDPGDFNPTQWIKTPHINYQEDTEYVENEIVKYHSLFYLVKQDMNPHEWSLNLKNAIRNLIKDSGNPDGNFDSGYPYDVGECCRYKDADSDDESDYSYYKSKVDFAEKTVIRTPFNVALEREMWEEICDDEIYGYIYRWDLYALVQKAAAVLCYTVDEMFRAISSESKRLVDTDIQYPPIWKYGKTNNLVNSDDVDKGKNIYAYASPLEPGSRPDSGLENPPIQFSENENEYLKCIVDVENPEDTPEVKESRMEQLRTEIIIYRILDGINKIENDTGIRKVCENPAESEDEMNEKKRRVDESETEGCVGKEALWVDRGDGLLIQRCNINEEHDPNKLLSARIDQRQGYNKLRYDQEYHFYKHFSIEHPLLFQKLQQKLKYFNPAFHSMTPEGFNARLNFLQQCTRQGNTKTMSDADGKTANNLAFGRPPYCILRCDFYNQMIVIESVSFDYNISEGLQWDLNPEGNGVQPMLCKVNISFKFIGGGDITGPVQRLQNAMSFNYYANTSFYDNRADRIEYQPTNWKTMGGAGNDQIDMENSYAYIARNYEPNPEINIVTPDLTHK